MCEEISAESETPPLLRLLLKLVSLLSHSSSNDGGILSSDKLTEAAWFGVTSVLPQITGGITGGIMFIDKLVRDVFDRLERAKSMPSPRFEIDIPT